MQVRLYLPFVDLRYLQTSLSEFIAEPNDPHNSGKLFKRCGGKMIKGNVYDCRNTVTLSSKEIKGITKTNFSLFYPYGNELVGIYKIVMNITESNKMKMPANDLILYLNKHIDFNLRMLFEEPHVRPHAGAEDITKIKTTLLTIRNEMPRYYYLSTLRFKEKAKDDKGKKNC
ncbi:MAG: hypothetical protein PF486_09790 [Prolixibacteraceae bacterium]|jgi:hypothetical protein|nr:hypothetical protein [Prolixibacteraceae bacterium]